MRRRDFLAGAVAGVAATAIVRPLVARGCEMPNIVLIVIDDLGYGDLRCYNAAGKVPTPNLDALATQSMRFLDAHASTAWCSPTRYALATGRYGWRTASPIPLGPYSAPMIESGRLTLPQILGAAGYHTYALGKWHLGWTWPEPDANGIRDFTQPILDGPTSSRVGYARSFGVDAPNNPPYVFIESTEAMAGQAFTVGLPTDWRSADNINGRPGQMLPGWKFYEILPALRDRAVAYIQERTPLGTPFFLHFSMTSPHEPFAPTTEFYDTGQIPGQTYRVADFIVQTDAVIGEVLAAIDAAGIAGQTLVIVCADNGPGWLEKKSFINAGHDRNGPHVGYKGDIWEGGHRVPFIARWSGHIPAGTTSSVVIHTGDLFATLAALVGYAVPVNAGEDSENILPVLVGGSTTPVRTALVHHSTADQYALREAATPWKYIKGISNPQGHGPTTDRLYRLNTDPDENSSQIANQPAKYAALQALLAQYQEQGHSH